MPTGGRLVSLEGANWFGCGSWRLEPRCRSPDQSAPKRRRASALGPGADGGEVQPMQAIQDSLNSNALDEVHNRFRRVGERWNELVPWQTLAGWGAFLAGIGVVL